MPTDAPPELLQTECERIMSDLGLKHVADTKFGGETVRGLSGGQRRRVTLAKGVCAWPHLIFADEPGLPHAIEQTLFFYHIRLPRRNVIYISLANIPTFFAEKVVCVSEQAEGLYSGLAYLLASTVSSIPVAALSILAGTLIQYLITGPDPVYYRWYLFPEVYLNAFLLYLATDSLFQFFAVTQKSSAEAQNVALFFFGFISMFNGVAPTPSAFPVWIRWGIWVAPGAAMKCHRHPTTGR